MLSAGVLSSAGTGAADDGSTLTFDADASDVDGLASAAVLVDVLEETVRLRHEYCWDPDAVAALDERPRAALRLDLPTELGAVEDLTETVGLSELSRATAVLEQPTDGSTLLGGLDPSTSDDDWDVIPYVETTSPLCGTLAETNLRIARRQRSTGRAVYDRAELDTNTYDYTCEDEWYVPPEYNTIWYEDDRTLERGPDEIDADATYYNDDFPKSDRVWADHWFEVAPSRHCVGYEHSGDRSRFLLEFRSEAGYRG